jgi:hypothetical protein
MCTVKAMNTRYLLVIFLVLKYCKYFGAYFCKKNFYKGQDPDPVKNRPDPQPYKCMVLSKAPSAAEPEVNLYEGCTVQYLWPLQLNCIVYIGTVQFCIWKKENCGNLFCTSSIVCLNSKGL